MLARAALTAALTSGTEDSDGGAEESSVVMTGLL